MSGVRKLIAAATTGALAVGLIAVSSGAAAPSIHRSTAHARLATLDSHTSVGQVTGPGEGKFGAQIAHYTAKGNKLTGTSVLYNSQGSFSGPFTVTFKTNPDGSTTLTGTAKITNGTGIYHGATGTTKITGSAAKNATITNLTYKSAIKY
jgi:hypothetical protein